MMVSSKVGDLVIARNEVTKQSKNMIVLQNMRLLHFVRNNKYAALQSSLFYRASRSIIFWTA